MTELRNLEHFSAVYRSRSFRGAAEELGVSQSTLTKGIQRLETQLGVRLFNRTTRTVEPTDTARQLITKAENALQAAGLFNEEARLLAGGELGAVRIGAIALASETLIADALARLAQSHPSLEVEVIVGSSDVYRDLATGHCDAVVGDQANFAMSPHAPGLRMVPIVEEGLLLVHRAGHPAAGAASVEELLQHPLAIPSRYFNENQLFHALAGTSGMQGIPRYRLNSLASCLVLAARSDVVTLAPGSVVEQSRLSTHGFSASIVPASIDIEVRIRLALFTVANNAPTPAIRAFQNALTRV